jgi:hypothetical protein
MARPERFELPTAWFVARYSIQLSYGRVGEAGSHYTERWAQWEGKKRGARPLFLWMAEREGLLGPAALAPAGPPAQPAFFAAAPLVEPAD